VSIPDRQALRFGRKPPQRRRGCIGPVWGKIGQKGYSEVYIYSTYAIRLPCHVERPSFEFAKVLEENGNESSDIFSCLFSSTLRTPIGITPLK
jgi:hypothetical protein